MADYYSLIMDWTNYVQNKVQGKYGTSKLQLNRRQCEYVAQELLKLSQALQSIGAKNLELHHIQRTVILHLHGTVKRAQMLVERCCCENSSWLALSQKIYKKKKNSSWLVTAMTLGDTQEDFIAILQDLHQWSFILDMVIIGGSQSSQLQLLQTGEEDYQRLLKPQSEMRNAIEAAASLDREELLERIARSREDDEIQRVYLKSRLSHTGRELQNVEGLKTYTFSRDLGSGASGMVLQVNWLGQELALKILREIDRTEATVLDQVQHPNIVRLLHYWEEHTQDGPRSCIIMELMPRDLQKHIWNLLGKPLEAPLKPKKGVASIMPFPLPVAIDTMLQVAQAMRVLHEKKLAHRDLKTSNILVKPVDEGYLELYREGYLEVKLADFGSAKAYVNSSQTGDLTRNTGTTVYGAPEIFEKEKVLRERNFPRKADVWSFGMTCSEILTGKMPFADDAYRSTLHKRIVKNGLRPSLPEECPDYLQFCIKSCWELQPQRRPSFSDLCRMLRHAKLLSLGLMDVESSKFLVDYQTQAGVMKSGHGNSSLQQKELKMQKVPKKSR
jgi:serine/threonine protein kinase